MRLTERENLRTINFCFLLFFVVVFCLPACLVTSCHEFRCVMSLCFSS